MVKKHTRANCLEEMPDANTKHFVEYVPIPHGKYVLSVCYVTGLTKDNFEMI